MRAPGPRNGESFGWCTLLASWGTKNGRRYGCAAEREEKGPEIGDGDRDRHASWADRKNELGEGAEGRPGCRSRWFWQSLATAPRPG